MPKLERVAADAIVLVLSNPVDILAYATLKLSSFPRERVTGAGTILDASRFRHELGRLCGVDPRSVHAHVIGGRPDDAITERVPKESNACLAAGRSPGLRLEGKEFTGRDGGGFKTI